jgi:hypothetical protein
MTVFSRSKTKLPAGPRSKLCSIIAGSAFPVVSRCGVPLRLKYRPSTKTLDDILDTQNHIFSLLDVQTVFLATVFLFIAAVCDSLSRDSLSRDSDSVSRLSSSVRI